VALLLDDFVDDDGAFAECEQYRHTYLLVQVICNLAKSLSQSQCERVRHVR
jgi:hypothetical protein